MRNEAHCQYASAYYWSGRTWAMRSGSTEPRRCAGVTTRWILANSDEVSSPKPTPLKAPEHGDKPVRPATRHARRRRYSRADLLVHQVSGARVRCSCSAIQNGWLAELALSESRTPSNAGADGRFHLTFAKQAGE